MPATVAEAIRAHLADWPPVPATLPWEDPKTGKPVTVHLVLTSTRRKPINRATFDEKSWRPAVTAAGMVPTRATGMHSLRHFYASALLDAGESIKALSEYLGHADPGFTLRTYTHLMPSSEESTRRAIDNLFGGPAGNDGPGDGDGPATARGGE